MKKLFSNLLAIAIAAFAFTACEDVPSPYSVPQPGQQEEVVYTGSGTKADPYTVADAIAYAKSFNSEESDKSVFIKGKVAAVTEEFSTQYGNGTFTISDDGSNKDVFTAYRVLYLGNQKFKSGDTQIKVGDEVILYGKVVNFKGNTPETVQGSACLYSLNGEFIDIEEGEAGTPKGDGSLENPFNAAAAIAYAQEIGDTESPKEVYIAGKISGISEEFSTQYGNGTFTISDDGKAGGSQFTCYRVLYLGNKKFTSSDTQIKQGDDVIVCGKVTNFKGNTPETVQGSAYLYSLNGKTAEGGGGKQGTPTGDGSLGNPFNAAAAIAYAQQVGDTESPKEVYIAGKVADIREQFGAQYGNGTFTISDDGKTGGSEFLCYRVLYLGNQKFASGNTEIKQGDDVIVCGKVTNFKGNTPEPVLGSAYLYSLNGKTEAGGGGGGGTEGTPAGDGSLKSPFNAAAAIAYAQQVGESESPKEVYIAGKVADIREQFGTQFGNGTFTISDDGKTGGSEFLCYRVLYLGNQKYAAGNTQIKKGDDVIVYGKVTNFKGNTPETVQGSAYLYSLNGQTEASTPGGGSEGGGSETGGGEVSGNSITVTFANMDLANQEKPTTLTLSDGTTLTFADGGNKNAPAYYNTGTALRMYPNNTMTINAGSKKIAAIAITCDEYNGTLYNASGDIEVGGKKMTVDGSSLKFTGPNASSATVANVSSTTGAPSQLRMKVLTITYAK